MKTILIFASLFFGLSVFAQTPKPPATTSAPIDWTVTEAGANSPEFQNCPECRRLANQNPVNAQGQQLVINWDRVRSRYSFDSLSQEDKAAVLGDLQPGDRETIEDRLARTKYSHAFDSTGGGASLKDRVSGGLGARLGLGDNSKVNFKVGRNKLMIKIEKKF